MSRPKKSRADNAQSTSREIHDVSLARLTVPGEESQSDLIMEVFNLKVSTWLEDGHHVAVCDPLEGVVVGVGSSDREALLDFVEGFKAIVDYHAERDAHEEFLRHYFQWSQTRETIEIRIEAPSQREKFLRLCPPWQGPSPELMHAVAG